MVYVIVLLSWRCASSNEDQDQDGGLILSFKQADFSNFCLAEPGQAHSFFISSSPMIKKETIIILSLNHVGNPILLSQARPSVSEVW